MPQLKICGITDTAFAIEAAKRGIDYLGLIFAKGSPRRVTVEQAREIAAAARGPRFVGVFVEQSVEEIARIAEAVPLDVIQLHGDYGAEEVAALKGKGYEVWRLCSDIDGAAARERDAPDAVLLDGRDGARSGGTGKLADWSRVEELKRAGCRVVLAGGISAANIAAAVATGADILDVNSSLETSPGKKSIRLLDEFLAHMPRNIMVK